MISVGIDVSKDKSTVCIMKPGCEVLAAPYEMVHTMESVLALASRIYAYDEEVRVVLEDTGHYHWPIVTLLVEKGIFITSVNALRMKKFCAQSIRKAKTDKIDSIKIKKQDEGKAKKCCKIAGVNKLLKIYYARVLGVYKEIDEQVIFGSQV